MLIIQAYSDRHRKGWDDFVRQQASGSLFHLIGWKQAVERSFGHQAHYLMAIRAGEIRGILPLFEVKSRLFGHALVSVPFAVYGGICAADADAGRALRGSAESMGSVMGVDYVEVRDWQSPQPGQVQEDGHWHAKNLYVTFRKEIHPDLEANMQAIPRKQRAMVRKGLKSGLVSRVGRLEDLEAFYGVYARNVRDLGTPVFPVDFFRHLLEIFTDAFILSIWKDDRMVAGVLTFVFKKTLMPYYGAGLREFFADAVNDFMYWELIRYGCENGYQIFDFGRSKKETGAFHYKCHWGFEPQPLDYRVHLVRSKELPDLSPLNPRYDLLIKGWKCLPMPVANWLGPKLIGGIP
jgi:FemAB-related protein (PEP-CTERM system-associated)